MNNDSTHVVPEPIKPVRIEHVADDVKLLKKSDVQQQRTLLTGRALKDLGSAVAFEFTGAGEYDAKYLTAGKIDFNKLVDSDIRFLAYDDDSVNGPSGLTSGSLAGIISITNVLPSGALTWDSSLAASRIGHVQHIRQIYWPADVENPGGYTRVGKWNDRTSSWDWSNWAIMSPETVNRIIITDKTAAALSNLLPNSVYQLNCDGCDIVLPSALSMKVGTVIGFEQYPNPKALEAADETNKTGIYAESWSSVVRYEAPDPITTEHGQVNYQVVLASALDPIKEATKETGAHGTWYENAHCGVTYKFENISIVPFEKDGKTYDRMWSLMTDQDADQVVPELSELMDKHTDQSSGDFVGFNSGAPEAAWNTSFKFISKKADTRGLFKIEINRTGTKDIPSKFHVYAYLVDEDSAVISYTEVNKPATNPDSVLDPTRRYYYQDAILGKKVLAGRAGVVTSWNDVSDDVTKLYYSSSVAGGYIASVWSSNDTTGKYGTSVAASFFNAPGLYRSAWFDKHKHFVGYVQASANQILTMEFGNIGSTIDAVKGFISVKVTFIPDAHDSYLFKDAVVDASGSVEDVKRRSSVPWFKTADATSVASSRDEIISTLQSKGMFYGNIRNEGVTNLNNYINPGAYTFVNTDGMQNVPPLLGGPNGSSDTSIYATLTVTSSKSFSALKKKPGDDLVFSGDTAGVADDAGFERITQIMTAELRSNSASPDVMHLMPRMWLRHGIKTTLETRWTSWVHFEPGRTIHEFGYGAESYTGISSYEIESIKVASLLANGKPLIILKNPTDTPIDPSGTLPTVTVNLPDPTPYVNTTFQIEAESNINVEVKYSVNGETYEQTYLAVSTPNHLLINIECGNGLWYVVAT